MTPFCLSEVGDPTVFWDEPWLCLRLSDGIFRVRPEFLVGVVPCPSQGPDVCAVYFQGQPGVLVPMCAENVARDVGSILRRAGLVPGKGLL